jgi:hypothetical protein
MVTPINSTKLYDVPLTAVCLEAIHGLGAGTEGV